MSCCKKRTKRIIKKNKIIDSSRYIKKNNTIENDNINFSIIDINEILCGGCKLHFPFEKIKTHCNICNQFFHCKIAGICRGDNCKIINHETNSIQRASYCYNCVTKVYDNNECLCKECSIK